MTESEWLTSSDPTAMLGWLGTRKVRVSDRKLRLFACACVRQVWHLLADERSRQAVEVAERFADGRATAADLDAARAAAWGAARAAARAAAWDAAWAAARDAARDAARAAAWGAARDAARAAARDAARDAARAAARAGQADTFRDVVGNPWCPPVLVIGTGIAAYRQVLSLARAANEERGADGTLDPHRLLVLADALEEAGCDYLDLLRHLRGEGPHVRGCWVIDCVLGRE